MLGQPHIVLRMPTAAVPCRRAGPRKVLPDRLDSGLRRSTL